MLNFDHYLLFIFSYLLGSVPFGLILGKFFAGRDVRQYGSGNIGATNVTRILGKKLGFFTLILDGLKGLIPVLIAKFYFEDELVIAISAVLAVVGHIFPIWLKFKGGKGVATTLFVLLGLEWKLCVLMAITWLVIYKIFKLSALSALVSIIVVFITSVIFSCEIFFACFLFMLLILIRHKSNMKEVFERLNIKS